MQRNPHFDLLDAIPLPIACLDPAGRLQSINAAFVAWFDCKVAAMQGQPLSEVLGDAAYAAIVAPLRQALAGEQSIFSGSLVDRSTNERRVRVNFIPYRLAADEVSGVVMLLEPHPQPAPPTTVAATADPATAQLLRMRALGDMTIALAHELSQPLSATLAYIQGSLRQLRDASTVPAELVAGLERAAAEARRAADLVGYIRRFARGDKPARRPVYLHRLLVETAQRMRAATEARNIAFSLALAADLPAVNAEPIAIEQVVISLLHNSVEALLNAAGGTPHEIRLTARRMDETMIEIAISDTGPGIAQQVAAHLFEPFASSKPDGVGLGLAICRTIIREHGGELWCECDPQSGTSFLFTLPTGTSDSENARIAATD